jgi:hypothetical protein
MCTVTYVPAKDGFCLTSNRDEQVNRKSAMLPQVYKNDGYSLLYPKDGEKEGSWIIAKSTADFGVLLNGAFNKHEAGKTYTKSRGLILVDIMMGESPDQSFRLAELEGIEPFTLILFTHGKLVECRWDGVKKHITFLDTEKAYIWSSATLYDSHAAEKRSKWFNDWYGSGSERNAEQTFDFHRFGGESDLTNGLVINRGDKLKTVSITQIQMKRNQLTMTYYELNTDMKYSNELEMELPNINRRKTSDLKWFGFKKFMIKLSNWEYWPVNVIYAPIMLYWFWLSFKSKSLFFFSTSNPLISNGGFTLESKAEIYGLIPQKYYPTTLLFKEGTGINAINCSLSSENLSFPVIAKPDIGARGVQVKLIHSESQLMDYIRQIKVDFLIQEHVDYKNEVGIFYYRLPGEAKGSISGIVGKEFLTVTGDGRSTVKDLLLAQPRYLLQLPILRDTYAELLDNVLELGKEHVLVPYGNHSRGAKFVDLSHLISDKLTASIDAMCQEIPEFYFGRLDIMYDNWEDLSNGKNLSIIELNGAGSEPTHIYDPKHSIFFAWKEITRHWKLLYTISKLNNQLKGLSYMSYKQGVKMLKDNTEYFKLVA